MAYTTTKSEYNKKYYAQNKEKHAAYMKDWYAKNREKHLAYSNNWNSTNKDRRAITNKLWAKNNKDKKRANDTNYRRKKYQTDINFKIADNLRSSLRMRLKTKKCGSAVKDLGCSIPEFKIFVQNKFSSGMTWSNHGKWHLDHIKPLASFNLAEREEFLKAAHFTNYQPLWAAKNWEKGAKC